MSRILRFLKKDYAGIILGAVLFLPAVIFDITALGTLSLVFYILALVGSGYSVFISAARAVLRKDFFGEKILMSLASVGAMIIGEHAEAVAVMLFFLVGEFFEHRAVRRSRASIKSLMQIRPDTARILEDSEEIEVDAEDVEVGQTLIIRPGERIPVDCRVLDGEAEVDTSAITGEAIPVGVYPGCELQSGGVVSGGALRCIALSTADSSCAGRILELVENASDNKSREEALITRFSRYYTPSVIAFSLLFAIFAPVFRLLTPSESIYRALSFLVVSCPCALVISVPMAFFGGIGGAASRGVLFKGGNVFSAVARTKNLVLDKTGTITVGRFSVCGVYPTAVTKDRLLALAASCEQYSNHPIARSVVEAADTLLPAEDFREIVGKGVVATVEGRRIAVGNGRLMSDENIDVKDGKGIIHVAEDGVYLGYIALTDSVKEGAGESIAQMRTLGVERVSILSGDRKEAVEAAAGEIGADLALGELMPEGKYTALEAIMKDGGVTMYVGDGINDAPCLARADVGVAMGMLGQDSAIEAADLVIMSDNLSALHTSIRISRDTLRIAKENIVFSISVKLAVIALVAFNFAGMWLAVFADVGVAVIAILNAMRVLSIAKRR